jgi:AmmeMemoRadiSam system protein A
MSLLAPAAKHHLVQRARRAIVRAIGIEPLAANPVHDPESLIPDGLRAGAFVTLRIEGNLRGCIGYPQPDMPLVDVIDHCAVSAAISDPRFPPLRPDEWKDVEVELSVLGPMEPVGDISEVVVGRHGLIVEIGRRRGLLLPQVAVEWGWNAEQFAAQTCAKAGLPRDAWLTGAKLFKFEAEVFGDELESH